MGFLRRLFGPRPAKPPRPPPPPPPVRFQPSSFPFSGEIRVRHEDYGRLATGWWSVSVASPEEWDWKIAEMEEGIRMAFGRIRLQDGQAIRRWTEDTWELVRSGLVVERR